MRIGVDATGWLNNRGYGRHARGVLRSLVRIDDTNRYVFLLDAETDVWKLPVEAEVRLIRNSSPTALAASGNGHRSVSDLWRMSRALSAPEFDLLLFPSIYTYVPVYSTAKKVVMIHDVIAETFPHLTVPKMTSRYFWKTKVALGHWQADAIVTVSDYSRVGILQRFKTPPERVLVVGEASDPVFGVIENPQPSPRLRALNLSSGARSVIYVGGFGPHKNLERLIAAFAALTARSAFADVNLVMVGEYEKEVFHSSFKDLRSRIQELGLADHVIFTGYLPDEELAILLNLATVLVLPSLMEGFGLPAIEAAACGCPVIATKASPLPSLLGEGALYINPTDTQDLEFSLRRVLSSEVLRRRMRAAGLAAAGRFSWDAAARQMIDVINKLTLQ
jgi:glycosyltransferase involved in cell wall biosynthesis